MLVMIGGGHTHALVLKQWIEQPVTRPEGQVLLISQYPTTPYGGWLSSVIQKRVTETKVQIPIQHLCSKANVEFMQDVAIGLNLAAKEVYLGFRVSVHYSTLSLNCGVFVPRISPRTWRTWIERLEKSNQAVVVLGAGVSGVETALALRVRFPDRIIQIVDSAPGLLPDHSPRFGQKIAKILAAKNIDVQLTLASEQSLADRFVINCSNGRAPRWMHVSGLEITDGLISTRPTLQTSDPSVFATGACARLVKSSMPRAHAFANREAPILATNLRKATYGMTNLLKIRPQRRPTMMMPVDQHHAMLVRGGLSLGPGALWMKMKDHIDQKFFAELERIAQ